MREFLEFIKPLPNATIASIGGRYYGMDRDNNWERVQKSYDTLVGLGKISSLSPDEYIASEYATGRTDEFIEPVLFSDDPTFHVREGDAIVHMNFRADRAIQMTKAFIEPDKTQLKTKNLTNIRYVAMTNYYPDMPCDTLVEDDSLENTLGQILANHGRTQLRLAETEKFAHVTKFFDGGKNVELPGKKEILVPSHKVATYDLDPEMSASEIWDVFQREAPSYDMTIVNFANGDMVGHTGSIDAARRAVEKLDVIIAQMIEFCANQGIELLITADHGNCEEMGIPSAPKTQHSLNPVPCWHIYDGEVEPIAPTG
jgi:2,3-bisphosphoglycerate-independent phosphoglycerate mutase